MNDFVSVAACADVPEDRGLRVTVANKELAVFHAGSSYCVLGGKCPHRGGPLAEGYIEEGKLFCPIHGWEFELATGRCANRPDKPARLFPSRVVNGVVEAILTGESDSDPSENGTPT